MIAQCKLFDCINMLTRRILNAFKPPAAAIRGDVTLYCIMYLHNTVQYTYSRCVQVYHNHVKHNQYQTCNELGGNSPARIYNFVVKISF